MHTMATLGGIAGALLLATGAAAADAVENFALLDQHGRYHELYEHSDASAVVLFVQGNGCPIVRNSISVINTLHAEFAERGVVFLALNASPQDDRAAVAAEANAYGLEIPVLLDDAQLVAESLAITRTAEALVVDPRGWRILYRGPVDDRLSYETQRPARRHYVREALVAKLEGRAIDLPVGTSPGCLIHFPNADPEAHARISYAEDVAPILAARCRSCHRPGGVAPWAMTGYPMVHGWSPMMREVIRTRRMPPWHADAREGFFANDIGLTSGEARTLVHWVEAGSPRGEGPDPLAESPPPPPVWQLGEPDAIVEAPAQEIPATGVVPYRYVTVKLPFDREVWLRAADIRPTNPAVTHHATAYIEDPRGLPAPEVEGPRWTRGLFAGYVPGREPEAYPEGGGFRLPRGARIRFQLHYTPTGKPEVDVPRIGLYLAETRPEHEIKIGAAVNFHFLIPAGAREYEAVAERRLSRDVVVYRVTPHMHYRGRWMRIEAHRPDGRVETLVSVPRYNFNWQRQYVLAKPVMLPKGTRVVARAAFDNSARNPANPDPTRDVGWGEQSFDEMLIGYFLYRDVRPTRAKRSGRNTRVDLGRLR